MRRAIYPICLTILFFFLSPSFLQAKSSPNELDHLADKALTYTQFGELDKAKLTLQQFKDTFESTSFINNLMTMDQLRILTVTFDQAEEAVTAVDMNNKERIAHVKRFRLAYDATHSSYQPLWVKMETPVMSAFKEMKAAMAEGNVSLYHEYLNEFLVQYSIVQPSIQVDLASDRAQEVHARVQYVDRYRQDILKDETKLIEVDKLEHDLHKLFDEMTGDETDPSFWWVMFTTGGIIISTLSYVGFRKYRAERTKKEPKRLHD